MSLLVDGVPLIRRKINRPVEQCKREGQHPFSTDVHCKYGSAPCISARSANDQNGKGKGKVAKKWAIPNPFFLFIRGHSDIKYSLHKTKLD